MKLHDSTTNPTDNALLVCRNARFNLIILLLIFWAIPFVWWYLEAPSFIFYLCTGLAVLLTPLFLGSWRTRGRPENWVLALYNDGIWLNLRDSEYYEIEPAETVLFIPYSEISSARKVTNRYTTPSSDNGTTYHKDIFLELELQAVSTESLRTALLAERKRQTPKKKYFGGFVEVGKGKIKRQPVDLKGENLLRVKFSSGNYGLVPGIKKVLATLARFVTVELAEQTGQEDWRKMTGDEIDQLVLDLVQDGRDIEAIKVMRRRNGMSTTEAHTFIKELREDQ